MAGTLLELYSDYVGSGSEPQYAAASNLFFVIDAVLIPLGVGLLVGGIVVAALRNDRGEMNAGDPTA